MKIYYYDARYEKPLRWQEITSEQLKKLIEINAIANSTIHNAFGNIGSYIITICKVENNTVYYKNEWFKR